ncbi:hypothetical protein [Acidithiobacillus caldus]|jgi:hypothetical protein|uniref:hypothetical protein n=1 Tax=Acidithiobacillus caldus TaxID=33059 RepID=UPI001D01B545|nr:hypothetical protein [Acidithiobacillus caldus]
MRDSQNQARHANAAASFSAYSANVAPTEPEPLRVRQAGGSRYAEVTTRLPVKLHLYTRALAFALGKTLKSMYQDCAEQFLREAPWKYGLRWRPNQGQTFGFLDRDSKGVTGWTKVNVCVRYETALRLEALAAKERISVSSLCYTMLYWWAWHQYPPAYERERRAKALANKGESS